MPGRLCCQFRPEDIQVGGGTRSELHFQGPGGFGVGIRASADPRMVWGAGLGCS